MSVRSVATAAFSPASDTARIEVDPQAFGLLSLEDQANLKVDESEASSPTPAETLKSGMGAIAEYIPAEGLALYVAVTAFVGSVSWLVWVGLLSSLLLSILVISLAWIDAGKQAAKDATDTAEAKKLKEEKRPGIGRLFGVLVLTLVLQAIYIAALPDNPITSRFTNGTVVGGALVIIAAAFLPLVGPRLLSNDYLKKNPKPGTSENEAEHLPSGQEGDPAVPRTPPDPAHGGKS